jgi:hypothetical protein
MAGLRKRRNPPQVARLGGVSATGLGVFAGYQEDDSAQIE